MIKYCSTIILMVLMVVSFSGYAQIKNLPYKNMVDSLIKKTVPLINIAAFNEMDKTNVYVLDTREKEEFEVSHLKTAKQVGYIWFDMRSIYNIPKNATIVLYCSVGSRAERVGEKILKAGYTNVYNLYGSIFEWVNEGLPVYKSNGVQTSEVHTYNKAWSKWVQHGTKVY